MTGVHVTRHHHFSLLFLVACSAQHHGLSGHGELISLDFQWLKVEEPLFCREAGTSSHGESALQTTRELSTLHLLQAIK